jgi:hypothetical protein
LPQAGRASTGLPPIDAELRVLDDVRDRHTRTSILATFLVENGRPGAVRG